MSPAAPSPLHAWRSHLGRTTVCILLGPLGLACREAAAEPPPVTVPAHRGATDSLAEPDVSDYVPPPADDADRGDTPRIRDPKPRRAPDVRERPRPFRPASKTSGQERAEHARAAPHPNAAEHAHAEHAHAEPAKLPPGRPGPPAADTAATGADLRKDAAHAPGGPHSPAPAAESGHHAARVFPLPFVRTPDSELPVDRARAFLRDFTRDNAAYMRTHDATFFKPFVDAQHPRATIVTCSDSRVQSHALDRTPENDLFTIRNIGNQIASSEGSVEYGIEHLKTPLLVIVGHFGCGAVKAALGNHSQEPPAIRHEIDTIDLSPVGQAAKRDGAPKVFVDWKQGVLLNVHHQVAIAMAKFEDALAAHQLIVVGAVYDFRNDSKQGAGTLQFINVNGNTNPAKIDAFARAIEGGQLPTSKAGAENKSPAALASAAVAAASAAVSAAGSRALVARPAAERRTQESGAHEPAGGSPSADGEQAAAGDGHAASAHERAGDGHH